MPPIFKKFKADRGTYYVRLGTLDAAGEIYIDTRDPDSQGFGGSVLKFPLDDGTVDEVKGPWHTNSVPFFDDTGINLSELHLTKITLWVEGAEPPIYEEKDYVLGPHYRGYRIARQLAILWNKKIKFKSESHGGSSTGWEDPIDRKHDHPNSMRKEDKSRA